MLVGLYHCLKKNSTWPEANQSAIYKCDQGFEHGTTENKSSWQSGQDLNSGPPKCKSSAINEWPSCLRSLNPLAKPLIKSNQIKTFLYKMTFKA